MNHLLKIKHMKYPIIIFITIIAFYTAVAFRYSITTNSRKQNSTEVSSFQKRYSIQCVPNYIPSPEEDIPLLSGWGNYHWPITTHVDSAQIYFNQGINMYFAFHIIEARASFDKATKLDPLCAMAWWGKALSFGPNINDFEYNRPNEAFTSAAKAYELKGKSNQVEKALIDAIYIRYSADTSINQVKLNILYKEAMASAYKQFNTNENVATLFADALMLLHPWDLYYHDFKPKPWTAEIVNVLHQAIRLNKNQPGAHHYLIHTVEASANPEEALNSAEFLETAMPEVSHIVHMPSHIYIRTGNFTKGIQVNEKALSGYQAYLKAFPATEESSFLYELHNVHMKLNCAQMAGNYKIANEASKELQQKIPPFYLSFPGSLGNYVQYLHQSILFTQLRFGKWEKILELPINDSLSFASVLQHFARGMAFAKTNRLSKATVELSIMLEKMKNPVLKEPLAPFNSSFDAALVSKSILEGTIAEEKQDFTNAIIHFKKAVVAEDQLIYNEPRDWLLPARQYLGNSLLKAGKYNESVDVYNKDLIINPNNGWALTGLKKCFKALNNKTGLDLVEKRMQAAWLLKDISITASVF